MTIKQKLSIALWMLMFAYAGVPTANAQIPVPPDPSCAYCGVNLKTGEAHKRSCRYYSEPASASQKGNTPTSEISSRYSAADQKRLYGYGHGTMCPHCLSIYHTGDCLIQYAQRRAKEELTKAEQATTESARKRALFNYRTMEDNINTLAKTSSKPQTSTPQNTDKRIKLSFECNLCQASVQAYNVNEAIKDFADHPWLHKPTCQNYQPQRSTKLKDYTPTPERPKAQQPENNAPIGQPAPLFSGINETNIRHEKPVSLEGEHPWGEIDLGWKASYESLLNESIPSEFDIERYNHSKGAVVLGTHEDNGRYHWTILTRKPNGDLQPVAQKYLNYGISGYTNIGQLRDVHFEAQGKFIIAEYTSGYRLVFDQYGEFFRDGFNIEVLGRQLNGKRLLYVGEDEQTATPIILNEDGEVVAEGPNIK